MNTNRETTTVVSFGDEILQRMVTAVELVRQRLLRATEALATANIPYAVIGGNAVAAWVSKVDPGAARNTVDVDLLVRRTNFDGVKSALESAGFVHAEVSGIDLFLDGSDGRPRDAVHIVFADEKVRPNYADAAPGLTATEQHATFRVLALEPLVRMKLTSFRRKDQVHLLDLIEVGLVDRSWLDRLPAALAARLKELLDNPEG